MIIRRVKIKIDKILINDKVTVKILACGRNSVKVGIVAPRSVRIEVKPCCPPKTSEK